MERVLTRNRAEELLDVAVGSSRRFQELVHHRLRALAFNHGERDQGSILGAEPRALLEEQVVISRLRFTRHRQGVNGKATIRQSVPSRIAGGAAKLFAQVSQQLL